MIPTKIHEIPPKGFKPTVHVSGLLLCYQGKFLILKREKHKPQPLTWGIPSGKLEKGESPLNGLIREVKEEIGLTLKPSQIEEISTLYVNHPDLDFCYHVFYTILKKEPKIVLNRDEHSDAKWVTLESAKKLPLIGGGFDVLDYSLDLLSPLIKAFKSAGDMKAAEWQFNYMRKQFPFLGIPKPKRDLLQKDLFKKRPILTEDQLIQTVQALWDLEEREFQYAAMDLLYFHRTLWTEKLFKVIHKLLQKKSWWETVDTLSVRILGEFLKKFPQLMSEADLWIEEKNFWLKRAAILYPLLWKNARDEKLLFENCLKLKDEKEFFIQKALGWALRQHSKCSPEAVTHFLKENMSDLHPLAYREGKKDLQRKRIFGDDALT